MSNEPRTQPRRPLIPGPTPQVNSAPAPVASTPPPLMQSQDHGRTWSVVGVANLAKAISGVMSEVGTIKKGGVNRFHNYSYARLEDLLYAVTPLMGKHGIVVIQNEISKEIIENRIAVTYEFSIFHTSGEVWPERPRFTGMSMGRDSKGNWDDKAINKCHSAARKYFLLSLFQVPSGDFDDADDEGTVQEEKQRKPIPGPSSQAQTQSTEAPKQAAIILDRPNKISAPPGTSASEWTAFYLSAIEGAKTSEEVAAWDTLNDGFLQRLSNNYPDLYEKIGAATEKRRNELLSAPRGMPDPKVDTTESMNWVAEQLAQLKTWDAALAFWNTTVAPQESVFDPVEWEMLMKEWKRTEARLNPPDDEPEPENAPQ